MLKVGDRVLYADEMDLSPGTVIQVHGVLNELFKVAWDDGSVEDDFYETQLIKI